MKKLVCFLLLALLGTTLQAKDNPLSQAQIDDGWILLFDGETLFGWTPENGGNWRASGGTLSPVTDGGFLRTSSVFSDFLLSLNFRTSADGAGCSVYLRSTLDEKGNENGYQLDIDDSDPEWPPGSIVDRFKAEAVHPAIGRWHTLEAFLSGEKIVVLVDDKKLVDGKDSRAKGGFITLGCRRAAGVEFRNLKLRLLGTKSLFDGSDLAGWTRVGPPPPKKAGMLKKMVGGGGKTREAKWSVLGGAIHGERGLGQLETTAAYGDFVLQFAARISSDDHNQHPKAEVHLRGDPGKLASGYSVEVLNDPGKVSAGGGTGAIRGLAAPRRILSLDNEFFTETVAVSGRHIQVWVNGYPVNDFEDTRAEGTSASTDARTAAGSISLLCPEEKVDLDFRNLRISDLPKTLGKGPAPAAAARTAQASPPAVPAAAAAAPAPVTAALAPAPDPNKPRIQQLMGRALVTPDPHQKVNLYTRILELDPNNQVAFNAREHAQQEIAEAEAKENQQAQQVEHESQTAKQVEEQAAEANQSARNAFLGGDLNSAKHEIELARRLHPANSEVEALGMRIDSALEARTRFRYLESGFGVMALIGLVTVWWRRRTTRKEPYLVVIQGLDKGRRFRLEQEVTHIGAISEDGGRKNEIVLRDIEHAISRFHCEIHKRDGRIFLVDCASANGTRVDSKSATPGTPVRLKNGARVTLAESCAVKLRFARPTEDWANA